MGRLISRTEALRTQIAVSTIGQIWEVHDSNYDVTAPDGLALREALKRAREDVCDHGYNYFVESKNVAVAVFAAFGATEIYDAGNHVYAFDANGTRVGEAHPRRFLTEFQN